MTITHTTSAGGMSNNDATAEPIVNPNPNLKPSPTDTSHLPEPAPAPTTIVAPRAGQHTREWLL